MRWEFHLVLCALLSVVYLGFFAGTLAGVLLIFATGFLIDNDHILSYQLLKGDLLSGGNPLKKTHDFYAGHGRIKNFLPLHFLEPGLLAIFLLRDTAFFLPLVFGWGFHLAADLIYVAYKVRTLHPGSSALEAILARYVLAYRVLVARKFFVD